MKIAILQYRHAVPTCVTGPADIWSGMSRMYPLVAGKPLKREIVIDVVSESGGVISRSPFGAKGKSRAGKDVYDLVIIPAMRFHKIDEVLKREHKLIQWLSSQYKGGADLASICVGAFLLAETGLLAGKKATTNWLFADRFSKKYPDIVVQDDKVIVDQGRIASCGGAFSFTSFMIYLIEKFCGHEQARIASRILMINVHDQPQSSFSIFQFQHDHHDEEIAKIQCYIESNYRQHLTMDSLAARCHMSKRNFMRRFGSATSNTPLQYLQRVRIEAAKKVLESKNYGVERVASMCGYEDPDFFRKIFKRHVAMTPTRYQEKYGKGKFVFG